MWRAWIRSMYRTSRPCWTASRGVGGTMRDTHISGVVSAGPSPSGSRWTSRKPSPSVSAKPQVHEVEVHEELRHSPINQVDWAPRYHILAGRQVAHQDRPLQPLLLAVEFGQVGTQFAGAGPCPSHQHYMVEAGLQDLCQPLTSIWRLSQRH